MSKDYLKIFNEANKTSTTPVKNNSTDPIKKDYQKIFDQAQSLQNVLGSNTQFSRNYTDQLKGQKYNFDLFEGQDWNLTRAVNQPWTHQAGNAILRGLSSGVMTALEDTGYILDFENNIKRLAGIENVESNWLSDWAKDNKEALREALPIYRKNPDETFDFSDPGFYYDMFANVLDTAVGFGAVGMGAGALVKGVGAGIKALNSNRMLGWANNIGQSLQKGYAGNVGAAYITNFGEGKMMALELYENSYNSNLESLISDYRVKNDGADPDENTLKKFQKTSSSIAGGKADNFMMLNKLMMASEAFQLNSLFKATGLTRNMLEKPGFKSILKQQIKSAPLEAGEEIFQNVMSMEQQFQGEQDLAKLGVQIKDPISTNMDMMSRLADFATSDQALLEGMMGLFSGPIQYTATALPFQNFKAQKEQFNDQKLQLETNKQFFEDNIAVIAGKVKAKQDAVESDNPLFAEHIANNEFDELAVQNFAKGTTQNLYDNLNEALESSEYSEEEKTNIQDKIKRLETLEQTFTKLNKYQAAPSIMQNLLFRDSKIDLLSKLEQESGVYSQEVEKLFTPILNQYNKNAKPENQITIADVNQAVNSIDYVKFAEAYQEFQKNNKDADGKLIPPTISQQRQMLEETNPEAFDILNRRKATKELLLNNDAFQSLIGTKLSSSLTEQAIVMATEKDGELKSPVYNIGYEQLQNILSNNQDTDTKIESLNKLEKKFKDKSLIKQLVATKRAELENRLQQSKEDNNLIPDEEAQENAAKVANVKTQTTTKAAPGQPKGKIPGQQVDEAEFETLTTDELSLESEGVEDVSKVTFSPEAEAAFEDKRNIELFKAFNAGDSARAKEVANMTLEELQSLQEATDEEEGIIDAETLKEIKRFTKENPEGVVDQVPVIPSLLETETLPSDVLQNSDTEAKKADIEKRRQEELDILSITDIEELFSKRNITSKPVGEDFGTQQSMLNAYWNLVGKKINKGILNLGSIGQVLKTGRYTDTNLRQAFINLIEDEYILDKLFEAIDKGWKIERSNPDFEINKINAKYDAELSTLEQSTTTSTEPVVAKLKIDKTKQVQADAEIVTAQVQLQPDAEPEVRNYKATSKETNKAVELQTADEEVKTTDSQEDVKVISNGKNIVTPEYNAWLTNGLDKAGTKVKYGIQFGYTKDEAGVAVQIYNRYKSHILNGTPSPTQEELNFMVDWMPIKMNVMSIQNASTFLFTVRQRESGRAAENERTLRTQIINNSIQGIESVGTVKGSYGGSLKMLDDSQDDRNILDIPDLADTASKDLTILYIDPEGKLRYGSDPDIAFGTINTTFPNTNVKYKATGLPMSGALFIEVNKANGKPFPLKVNVRELNDNEITFTSTLLRDLLTRPEGTKQMFSQKVRPELLQYLTQADRDFLKDATYGEALSFMVYEGENSKNNPVTQLYINKGKVYFGGETITLNEFQTNANKVKALQEFLLLYKPRKVDLKRMSDNKYKEHILTTGVITTNANTDKDTLFESEVLRDNYTNVAERTKNRYKEASVYVNTDLDNPVALTPRVQTETKSLENKVKDTTLPVANITEGTKKMEETIKQDLPSKITESKSTTNIQLDAANQAVNNIADKFTADSKKSLKELREEKKRNCK
jgi:hypothetical protein